MMLLLEVMSIDERPAMRKTALRVLLHIGLVHSLILPIYAEPIIPAAADSVRTEHTPYDPFGPENSPDHSGQGSGGVITPSPHENLVQTYFTRINADYFGVQHMLDSPWQISTGVGWSAYQTHRFGILFKSRTSGFREFEFDPIREEDVPYYLFPFELSFDHPTRENKFRAVKFRVHGITKPKGLSMAGIGVLVSRWNLLVATDRSIDRKLELEATWIQIAGGYIMPLSPKEGGVNLAVCGAVDLVGTKYQSYYSDRGRFIGAKVGSIGWLVDVGWNVNKLVNLAGYVGGEWNFSTGALILPSKKIVFSDISRTSIYCGIQATGRWFNLTGGVQKEWEYLDFQSTEHSDKALRYYLGVNVYFRR